MPQLSNSSKSHSRDAFKNTRLDVGKTQEYAVDCFSPSRLLIWISLYKWPFHRKLRNVFQIILENWLLRGNYNFLQWISEGIFLFIYIFKIFNHCKYLKRNTLKIKLIWAAGWNTKLALSYIHGPLAVFYQFK